MWISVVAIGRLQLENSVEFCNVLGLTGKGSSEPRYRSNTLQMLCILCAVEKRAVELSVYESSYMIWIP